MPKRKKLKTVEAQGNWSLDEISPAQRDNVLITEESMLVLMQGKQWPLHIWGCSQGTDKRGACLDLNSLEPTDETKNTKNKLRYWSGYRLVSEAITKYPSLLFSWIRNNTTISDR